MTLTRRRALFGAAFAMPAVLLGACAVTSSGSTTTVTIDVTRIVTDGKAIIASVQAASLIPAVSALLGPNLLAVQTALAAANASLSEIETLTGGTVVLATDTSRVQALATSLLADAQTALSIVQGVLVHLSGTVVTQVQTYVSAALALLPFVQLAAGLSSARVGSVGLMTEQQALAVAAR
jgi:hypothetical protein